MARTFHLGLSSSAFCSVADPELMADIYPERKKQPAIPMVPEEKPLATDFIRKSVAAVNEQPVIEYFELYHSFCWDNKAVIKVLEEEPKFKIWSIHSNYGKYSDPSSPIQEVRDFALRGYREAAITAKELGAPLMVVHTGANAVYDVPRSKRVDYVVDTLTRAAEEAAKRGIIMAVEPLPKRVEIGNRLDEVMEIIDRIDAEHVGMNFDTNHLFPPSTIPGHIKTAGKMIKNVHISDDDGDERHWMPGAGDMDWKAVLDALDELDYKNPLIYETRAEVRETYSETTKNVAENFRWLTEQCGYNHI